MFRFVGYSYTIINPHLRNVDSRLRVRRTYTVHAKAFEPLPACDPVRRSDENPAKKLRRLVDELNLLVYPVMLGSGKGLPVDGLNGARVASIREVRLRASERPYANGPLE